jgi:hypothetical protein
MDRVGMIGGEAEADRRRNPGIIPQLARIRKPSRAGQGRSPMTTR